MADEGSRLRGEMTKGVQTLLGNPKKAIMTLAVPMIIAMSIQTLYNVVDALWVSGLGPDALAAVGFVYPFFFMMMALATGLGVGGGSAVSRRIGANDKKGADQVAIHTLLMMVILATVFTLLLLVFAEPIFSFIGAGEVLSATLAYGRVLFAGAIFVFFAYVANALLRGEGDAHRAMYALAAGAGLNIVLDPVFIYALDFGVAGAGWATVVSLMISSGILWYWLFRKQDTYVSVSVKGFRYIPEIGSDILRVGVPSSLQQLSMAVMMLILNGIIVSIGGTDGVAVYTTGWRVATMAILPLLGIATAVVSVSGAAYGEQNYDKIKISFLYAIKMGLLIEIIIAVVTFVLAPFIAQAFTLAEGGVRIVDDLELFLRIICLFYPAVAFGIMSSSLFQGCGKGLYALGVTLLRAMVFTPIFAVVFSMVFMLSLPGIWWGIVAANSFGSLIAFASAQLYIKKLERKQEEQVSI